jgi:hypothetical protein
MILLFGTGEQVKMLRNVEFTQAQKDEATVMLWELPPLELKVDEYANLYVSPYTNSVSWIIKHI